MTDPRDATDTPQIIRRPWLRWLSHLDPRRSLAIAIGWLIGLLTLGMAGLLGLYAGDITRQSMLERSVERATSAAEQWAAGFDAAMAQRRQTLLTAASMVPRAVELHDTGRLSAVFADLRQAYPEMSWVGLADDKGRLLASSPERWPMADIWSGRWLKDGFKRPWMDAATIEELPPSQADTPASMSGHLPRRLVVLAAPVFDPSGRSVAVVAAHLHWSWIKAATQRLDERQSMAPGAFALLVDAQDRVLAGPAEWMDRTLARQTSDEGFVMAKPQPSGALHDLGWRVVLAWPEAGASRLADDARFHIVSICLILGFMAAVVGVWLAMRLTRRLTVLTTEVRQFEPGVSQGIAAPQGRDEVSLLGQAFSDLLQSLRSERDALSHLSLELEARVQARTREVERLAEEARYTAVVRERLRIARDLHDTLAHSMMAMLAQIRLLRKLHARDPSVLGEELANAEQAAQAGLNEARAAITQIRTHSVRDLGLGSALAGAVSRFAARTGLDVSFSADEAAAAFADVRAEAVLRMAEEALRNIEQHAAATSVTVRLVDYEAGFIGLLVRDDGVGFDPLASHPGHYGLVGLREQAQLVGATLHLTSRPGEGVELTLRWRAAPDLSS